MQSNKTKNMCLRMCTCVFIFASCLGVCVSVCVFTAFVCVCDLARLCARVFVHICVCRTPFWWFSRCRAAGWRTLQSRLPASCAARGNFWSQPSLWSCSSTKMWMCSTHTRLSCICHPGATHTQVCWNRICLLWVLFLKSFSRFNLSKNTVSVIKKLFVLYFCQFYYWSKCNRDCPGIEINGINQNIISVLLYFVVLQFASRF